MSEDTAPSTADVPKTLRPRLPLSTIKAASRIVGLLKRVKAESRPTVVRAVCEEADVTL